VPKTAAETELIAGPDTVLFPEIVDLLAKLCREVVDGYVVDGVLQPLARAIALE
jgi:hypothetical protein